MSSARYNDTETRRPALLQQPPPVENRERQERRRKLEEQEKLELRSKTPCGKFLYYTKDVILFGLGFTCFILSLKGYINTEVVIVSDPASKSSLESTRSRINDMNIAIILIALLMGLLDFAYGYINLFLDFTYLFKDVFEGPCRRTCKKWIKRVLEWTSFIATIVVLSLSGEVKTKVANGYSPATVDEVNSSFNSLLVSLFLELFVNIVSLVTDLDKVRETFKDLVAATKFGLEVADA